ncbi:MAG: hypothetical protein ACRC2T_16115, partial [Thermoguttaceae bacterium]
MPNLLTITWDENRLLLLVAKSQGKKVIFEDAASVSLRSPSDKSGVFRAVSASSSKKLIPDSVSNFILDYTSKNKLAKSDVVFVLSRSDVEVRTMMFPNIPVDEIPEMIKFQASREFSHYDQNTPLDFFVLEDSSS